MKGDLRVSEPGVTLLSPRLPLPPLSRQYTRALTRVLDVDFFCPQQACRQNKIAHGRYGRDVRAWCLVDSDGTLGVKDERSPELSENIDLTACGICPFFFFFAPCAVIGSFVALYGKVQSR